MTNEEKNKLIEKERVLGRKARSESDYELFDENKRKKIILKYVEMIKDIGFKPVKVFAAPDENKQYSFKAMFEFIKPNDIGIKRKHTSFFVARNWSDFSLRTFNEEVLETDSMEVLNNFKKALRIRIWNIGYTDEEILAAILGINHELIIKDIVTEEGKLIIPKNMIDKLFWELNVTGGNQVSNRIIKRNNK